MCACISKNKPVITTLLEAGIRMEGLWSGYYTGLGVLGDDRLIRSFKTTGWSKYWQERFHTDELQGTMGMFHSRTGSGGDARYAHPFLSNDQSTLLCSQGSAGHFKNNIADIEKIGNHLLDSGIHFASADWQVPIRKYPMLKDGSQVHVSDIVCEYAAQLFRDSGDALGSIRQTALDILEEAVSLFIFRERPGHIYIANLNQRICIHFHEDGVILSTSSLAIADKQMHVLELPPNSVSDVTLDNIFIEKLSSEIIVDTSIPAGLDHAFISWVKKHPKSLLAHITDNALAPFFPSMPITMRGATAYRVFERLYYQGILKIEMLEAAGVGNDHSIRTLISIANDHSKESENSLQ